MTEENPQVINSTNKLPMVMTPRDYFAAAALTGMLSHLQAIPQKCVEVSFEIADAMLKAREQ